MKTKFPRSAALLVAKELCDALKPFTERLIVAGSLRRRKAEVGDIEIIYIPVFRVVPDGLFDTRRANMVDFVLEKLLTAGVLNKRLNTIKSVSWGDKNKLAVHVASGIPVDLFSSAESGWFNYLVCRTGGVENNRQVAMAANRKGWKWNPYGVGFTTLQNGIVAIKSERDVFEFVGLPYREPWDRL